jgi:hypothetical protein
MISSFTQWMSLATCWQNINFPIVEALPTPKKRTVTYVRVWFTRTDRQTCQGVVHGNNKSWYFLRKCVPSLAYRYSMRLQRNVAQCHRTGRNGLVLPCWKRSSGTVGDTREVSGQLHLPAVLSTALHTARVSEDDALYAGLRAKVTQIQTTPKPTICICTSENADIFTCCTV